MATISKDPGVGYKSNRNAQRFILNGKSNVKHINRNNTIDDLYTYLINISWLKFFVYVFCGYILINVFFGCLYMLIGIDEFRTTTGSFFEDFLRLFFFSAQTITTVGYGAIAPKGMLSGVLSSFQALVGLVSFSFITGLIYGRFSRPKAKVNFSKHILVRPFKGERALMFRVMNNRTNLMIEPELDVVINITEKNDKGVYNRTFFELKLERKKIMYLPTMWTVVHVIDKESPLSKFTNQEMLNLEVELYILFKYHEEAYNQTLYQIHSYDFQQLKINYKFNDSYGFDEQGFTVIDHSRLNNIVKV